MLYGHYIGLYIDEFVHYYRAKFPDATFLPKLHMLEDHVVPWVKKWRVGYGMMGEQGAESLHAQFNTTERAYNNMRDRVQRLKVVVETHHLKKRTSTMTPLSHRLKTRPLNSDTHYNMINYYNDNLNVCLCIWVCKIHHNLRKKTNLHKLDTTKIH